MKIQLISLTARTKNLHVCTALYLSFGQKFDSKALAEDSSDILSEINIFFKSINAPWTGITANVVLKAPHSEKKTACHICSQAPEHISFLPWGASWQVLRADLKESQLWAAPLPQWPRGRLLGSTMQWPQTLSAMGSSFQLRLCHLALPELQLLLCCSHPCAGPWLPLGNEPTDCPPSLVSALTHHYGASWLVPAMVNISESAPASRFTFPAWLQTCPSQFWGACPAPVQEQCEIRDAENRWPRCQLPGSRDTVQSWNQLPLSSFHTTS